MFKIASWNVNSLRVRLDQVLDWMSISDTDVLALQETKIIDELFPVDAFLARGYSVMFSGQKTYNGTAIISKLPMEEPITDLPAWDDPQRRILAVTIGDLRVIDLYVPNGAEVGSDKYQYKLAWLEQVTQFIKQQLQQYPKLVVLGDFNIAPSDLDVHSPKDWSGKVLVSEPERQAFSDLIALGLTDSFRHLKPDTQMFSWWDYRAAGFRRNLGLRIDHVLLSQSLVLDCVDAGVDVEPRRSEQPSDHAPVWVLLNLH
jgi:exodeoxyribonuclease-3